MNMEQFDEFDEPSPTKTPWASLLKSPLIEGRVVPASTRKVLSPQPSLPKAATESRKDAIDKRVREIFVKNQHLSYDNRKVVEVITKMVELGEDPEILNLKLWTDSDFVLLHFYNLRDWTQPFWVVTTLNKYIKDVIKPRVVAKLEHRLRELREKDRRQLMEEVTSRYESMKERDLQEIAQMEKSLNARLTKLKRSGGTKRRKQKKNVSKRFIKKIRKTATRRSKSVLM
jgi:hypothetical protein